MLFKEVFCLQNFECALNTICEEKWKRGKKHSFVVRSLALEFDSAWLQSRLLTGFA